jgi:hypothetical protein
MKTWKPLPFVDGYEVSDQGEIKRVKPGQGRRIGQCLRPRPASNGYLKVVIRLDGKAKTISVHRVVCAAFYGPCPDGYQVRHLDGNKLNNAVVNLKYGTPKENGEDKVKHQTATRGENVCTAKISESQAIEIASDLSNGVSATAIAILLEIPRNIVYKIKHGKTWNWLDGANNRAVDGATR